MNVSIDHKNDNAVDARISGEVDADNCGEVRTVLSGAALSGADTVVIDISDLTFIDSSGISALLDIRDDVVTSGGTLTLRSPTESVRRVLEITGLLETFGIS